MRNQKELWTTWAKIELNSTYYPTTSNTLFIHDNKVAEKITKEGIWRMLQMCKSL